MRLTSRKSRVLVLALVGLSVPAMAVANDDFADVPTSAFFHDSVGLIADAGVTAGCQTGPPALYCPNDPVTRGQMGVFMAKLGGLGTNPPVADALTAQTATNATNAVNATNADNATDSEAVNGFAASDLIRVEGDAVTTCTVAILVPACTQILETDYTPEASVILETPLTAPVDGGAVISFTAQAIGFDATTTADLEGCADFGIFVDGVQQGPTIDGIILFVPVTFQHDYTVCVTNSLADDAQEVTDREVLSATIVVPLAAGVHDIEIRAQASGGDVTVGYDTAGLSVVFSPFDGDGTGVFEPFANRPVPAEGNGVELSPEELEAYSD